MDAIALEMRERLLDRWLLMIAPGAAPSPAELAAVTVALARIDEGTYGRCQRCAGAIGRQRLRAAPEALLCLDCVGTGTGAALTTSKGE